MRVTGVLVAVAVGAVVIIAGVVLLAETSNGGSDVAVPDLIDISPLDTPLPFKRIPPELLPSDTAPTGMLETLDPTSTSVRFFEADSANHTGTRIRVIQSIGPYDLDIAARTDHFEVNGIEVNLQYGEGYENRLLATWNEGELGFVVEFLHITNGEEDALTPAARESYLSVIRSLIPRLATG